MKGDLPDVNVLLALAWPNHQFHAVARRWFSQRTGGCWYTSPLTQLGFLRLSCNPAFSTDFKQPAEAWALLHVMTQHPDHRFVEASISGCDEIFSTVIGKLQGHKQITDAYLLALAHVHQLRFLSFDRKIRAFCPFPDNLEILIPEF